VKSSRVPQTSTSRPGNPPSLPRVAPRRSARP
jgi:hypothetical protein